MYLEDQYKDITKNVEIKRNSSSTKMPEHES